MYKNKLRSWGVVGQRMEDSVKKTFVFFGGLSYALYLVHGYFMWIVSDNLTGCYLLNSLILLAVSVAVAIMLNQIVVILQKRKT